jgi:hypothetical protein
MTDRPLPSGWSMKVNALGRELAQKRLTLPLLPPKRSSGGHILRCQFCRVRTATHDAVVCGECAGIMAPPPAA